jgi:hypothetical protein
MKDFSKINIFREVEKKCDINGDYKRMWFDDFINVKDMLSRKIGSSTYTVGLSNIPDIRMNREFAENAYTVEGDN